VGEIKLGETPVATRASARRAPLPMPGFARALTRAPILILKEAKAEYVKLQ
jgi:hypothetical protein